jgi:hypothetical protein
VQRGGSHRPPPLTLLRRLVAKLKGLATVPLPAAVAAAAAGAAVAAFLGDTLLAAAMVVAR